jgi:MSHA biogenesis protein MshK
MKNLFKVQGSGFKVQGSRFRLEPGTRNPEHGTRNAEHAAAAWALGTVLAFMPALASPQVMTDPTRPPGFAAGEPDTGADPGSGPVLQSVMISPTRKAAIISGEMVRVGEKYGDAVLIKVAENEVVLKSGETTQVLKMYPGVEKREIVPAAAKEAPKPRKPGRGGADPAAAGKQSPR